MIHNSGDTWNISKVQGIPAPSLATAKGIPPKPDHPALPSAGAARFFAGNQSFLTRKLWGLYNQGPFGHAGKFTTMREAINLGHNGEATAARLAFQSLPPAKQDAVIEFLKSLQVLPPGTRCRVVDERNNCLEEEKDLADADR